MSTHTTTDERTHCERCGEARPHDVERLTVTFHDRTNGTYQSERLFLCSDCWSHAREAARRCGL